MSDDWIHPVQVGKKFAEYDLDDGKELCRRGARIRFSYYSRTHARVIHHAGTIVDVFGRPDAVYRFRVKVDDTGREFDICDPAPVRSVADDDRMRGSLTALDIDPNGGGGDG